MALHHTFLTSLNYRLSTLSYTICTRAVYFPVAFFQAYEFWMGINALHIGKCWDYHPVQAVRDNIERCRPRCPSTGCVDVKIEFLQARKGTRSITESGYQHLHVMPWHNQSNSLYSKRMQASEELFQRKLATEQRSHRFYAESNGYALEVRQMPKHLK